MLSVGMCFFCRGGTFSQWRASEAEYKINKELALPASQLRLNLLSSAPPVSLTGNKVEDHCSLDCTFSTDFRGLTSYCINWLTRPSSFLFQTVKSLSASILVPLHRLQAPVFIGLSGGLISTSCSYLLLLFHILIICCSFGFVLIDTYKHTFYLEHDFYEMLSV